MNFIHFSILSIISITCFAGPLEDIANTPELTLFYQQLIRQQDIQMLLQNIYPQQAAGGINDFTIFAPNNDAMMELTRKNEDLNLLWKYHIVSGRYDDQMLFNMAQEKFNQANPRQMSGIRPQNNLPTIAIPFQVFYGTGFYGGTGPPVNDSYDNAGYGTGGISWLTQTSFNQTNLFEDNLPINSYRGNNYNRNQNYVPAQGSLALGNQKLFQPNLTNYYGNNMNPQFRQYPIAPNMNYNPNLQQQGYGQLGPNGGIGFLRPTINNAFILQSRPMSRGVINVIDSILWPPERRDQTQYKTAYDALEDVQFSRLRQLAERSDYFRSELRSIHHQTWFLPNDQAFASMGSSLSFLLDQTSINNSNDINEFIKAHIIPLVLFPSAMDSTKQITTLSTNKWITFRKVTQPDQTFQIDVISGRNVARIFVSRSEDIRLYGNGIVYPISTVLSSQTRSAADELSQNYQYFMNLIQQSGDLELINILQGPSSQNMYNAQNALNITVLIPQQSSIQQLGNLQELSRNLRRHILRFPVYTDQLMPTSNSFAQQNTYQTAQQQPFIPQQQPPIIPQQQQPLIPQQQPFVQPGFNQQQQFIQPGFNQQQQFQIPQFQRTASASDKKLPRRRRQMNIPSNKNFQTQQYPQQQLPTQQQQFPQQQLPTQQQQLSNQQMLPTQQQQQPNQQMLPTQQQQFPNQQMLPTQQQQQPNQQMLPTQQQQLPNQQMLPTQQQQQQMLPNQQQQLPKQPILLNQQQPMWPTQQQQQQQQFNPNYYPTSSYPYSATFQNGQVYPTMDPQFSIEAQVSTGTKGNVVTLVGRPMNSLPFTATIIDSESNIPIKNGVMHVIRGLLSGTAVSLEGVLTSVQGASGFAQLLQQTGVIEQLKQAGRSYTLFIPTNAALQSIGVTTNVNRLRQFVLRHICADVLLNPTNNVLRRSAGYYSHAQNLQQKQQQRSRQKRQGWMNNQQNMTNRQGLQSPNLGPGYFQPQQQAYGGYPAAPTQFGSNNQMYNPGYAMNSYASSNPQYLPGYNGTYLGNQNTNFNNLGVPNQPISNTPWNRTMNAPLNRQAMGGAQNYYTGSSSYLGGSTYLSGPQSCMAMSGERITVQPLAGTQPTGNTPSMSYQNYMVTCCGDQSVNSMVQSFNIYPPSFAVYLIGRSLLSQGQTINTLYNYASKLVPSYIIFFFFIISIIFQQIHHS